MMNDEQTWEKRTGHEETTTTQNKLHEDGKVVLRDASLTGGAPYLVVVLPLGLLQRRLHLA